jgi:hypothetical protein
MVVPLMVMNGTQTTVVSPPPAPFAEKNHGLPPANPGTKTEPFTVPVKNDPRYRPVIVSVVKDTEPSAL